MTTLDDTGLNRTHLLSERCKEAFDPLIQRRGGFYHEGGQVSTAHTFRDRAKLTVRGTRTYPVEVIWARAESHNEIQITCKCPFYQGGSFCKHAWAALLKLDEEGVSDSVPGQGEMHVLHEFDMGLDEASTHDGDTVFGKEVPYWVQRLERIQPTEEEARSADEVEEKIRSRNSRIGFYALDWDETRKKNRVTLELYHREILTSGEHGRLKHQSVCREDLPLYTDPLDRELLALLLTGPGQIQNNGPHGQKPVTYYSKTTTPLSLQDNLLRRLCAEKKLIRFPKNQDDSSEPIFMISDLEEPWTLELQVRKHDEHYSLDASLKRQKGPISDHHECFGVDKNLLGLQSGLLIFPDRISRLRFSKHVHWIKELNENGAFEVPLEELDPLIEKLCSNPHTPLIKWPRDIGWKQVTLNPTPRIIFTAAAKNSTLRGLPADLEFDYDGQYVSCFSSAQTLLDKDGHRLLLRNPKAEQGFLKQLKTLPEFEFVSSAHENDFYFRVLHENFPKVASEILLWGWPVEAQGQKVRKCGNFEIKVSSGMDWFDLKGVAKFEGGIELTLPALLAAIERGERLIALGDGSVGMIPEEWLKRYASLVSLGEKAPGNSEANPEASDAIRFKKSQGALLSAWLAASETKGETIQTDRNFKKLQTQLDALSQAHSIQPSKSFKGKLRSYQKEGLSWLQALQKSEFGGILADDMGLGKTIQLLAHLDGERAESPKRKPSLVILPKSLMYNWKEEAAKFTPKLKVLSYAGGNREKLFKQVPECDLVLVTYSTLRQDILKFQEFDFHTVVADEAQAIKNSKSLSHKACRLIRADHRLALTGTPVENSIDDLFSIVNFVNPGLLSSSTKERMSRATTTGKVDTEALQRLSNALRPFILRRTKQQVLKELPEKTEKVLHCELSEEETRVYDELRAYYRSSLKSTIAKKGMGQSKIVILEALLRLRQAACHPGLIDKKLKTAESAKLETLVAQLQEVISEGHKALVFSQFTTFLDIVRSRLEREGIAYEYLDGQTSMDQRRKSIQRFQNEDSSKVFLISLKAGGVGLNLTAADYVFILDPWWNPAVESQAIDRVHRIGQKNKVIAYRLIAQNTVEEKIIDLQKSKRSLAEAIISAEPSLMKKLTPEDLELLLS